MAKSKDVINKRQVCCYTGGRVTHFRVVGTDLWPQSVLPFPTAPRAWNKRSTLRVIYGNGTDRTHLVRGEIVRGEMESFLAQSFLTVGKRVAALPTLLCPSKLTCACLGLAFPYIFVGVLFKFEVTWMVQGG